MRRFSAISLFRALALTGLLAISSLGLGQSYAWSDESGGKTVTIREPASGAVLDLPTTPITVDAPAGYSIALSVDSRPVEANLVGRVSVDPQTGRVSRTWYGVPLAIGKNTIVAAMRGGDVRRGESLPQDSVSVQVCGPPARIALRAQPWAAPADGRSVIHLVGKLVDAAGLVVRQSTTAILSTSAGEFVAGDAAPGQGGCEVPVRDGSFVVALKTGHEAQQVQVKARIGAMEGAADLRFSSELRPMIGAGVLNLHLGRGGSDFFDGFDQLLQRDFGSGAQLSGDSAAFFTGTVLRDWKMTTAYSSSQNLNQNGYGTPGLAEAPQFEEQQYPVYGDSSQVTDLAPSSDHLYARLERGDDYALWGDYGTQEFTGPSQQLSGLSRELHAFKTHFDDGPVQVTAFYGNNAERFVRDTIAPDGTRGDYFLTQRPVVVGSETISLEEVDADYPGRVVSATALASGTDYEIDYDRGTLLFAEPILRTDIGADGRLLLRQIVATYQKDTVASNGSSLASGGGGIYGGRLSLRLGESVAGEKTLGVTSVIENQGERRFTLNALDCLLPMAGAGTLTAELARSQAEGSDASLRGSAYRFNFDSAATAKVSAHVYLQRTDSGFVNNATLSFVPGQTFYGADVNARMSAVSRLFAGWDAQHTDASSAHSDPLDFLGDASSSTSTTSADGLTQTTQSYAATSDRTAYAGLEETLRKASLTVKLIDRQRSEDALPTGSAAGTGTESSTSATPGVGDGTSDQLQTRLLAPLTPRITLQALNISTFAGAVDPQYNDRTAVGANWQVNPSFALRATETHYQLGEYAGRNVLSLDSIVKQKVNGDFDVQQRLTVVSGIDGMQLESSTGCDRGWQIAPGLRAKATYERVSAGNALSGYTDPLATDSIAPAQAAEYSLLTGSSTSYGASLDYTALRDLKVSLGLDDRHSSQGSNTVLSALVAGKLSPAITALARYESAQSANGSVVGLGDDSSLRVGLAYRNPSDDRFNALLHYDRRTQSSTGLLDNLSAGASRESVFAAEAIYAPDWRWEFYGKLAARSSGSQIDEGISAASTLVLAQERVTRHLTGRIDLAGELRQITQSGGIYRATGELVETGYYVTPDLRLAVGYSVGRVRDQDFQGAAQNGGLYMGVTMKLGAGGL